jgi:hypothetical protein
MFQALKFKWHKSMRELTRMEFTMHMLISAATLRSDCFVSAHYRIAFIMSVVVRRAKKSRWCFLCMSRRHSVLSKDRVDTSDSGHYRCIASNVFGLSRSAVAELRVRSLDGQYGLEKFLSVREVVINEFVVGYRDSKFHQSMVVCQLWRDLS